MSSAPGLFRPPPPHNEPVREHAPGSPERNELRERLREMQSQQIEIPLIIGGNSNEASLTRPNAAAFDALPAERQAQLTKVFDTAGTGNKGQIINDAVGNAPDAKKETGRDLAEAIRRRFAPYGGVELDIPPREVGREPPDFST